MAGVDVSGLPGGRARVESERAYELQQLEAAGGGLAADERAPGAPRPEKLHDPTAV